MAAKRTPIVVGNWKLHKSIAEAQSLVTELKNQLAAVRDVEIGVGPVFTSLAPVAQRLEGSNLQIYAQDCHWEESGAWTGEVGPGLLRDAGCYGVILGHSERRHKLGETDETVRRKVRAALDAGLAVIACVGETEEERDAGKTEERIGTQLTAVIGGVEATDLERLVIAYEPVWAIGTGRTATPSQAQEVHGFIRSRLEDRYAAKAAEVRIQYGGSVKPDNAEALLAEPDIDGALVGGASLKAETFVPIVKAGRVASAG